MAAESWRYLSLLVLATACLERRAGDETPDWSRCSSCHGTPSTAGAQLVDSAPPRDLFGNTESEYPGVGAHRVHLYGTDTHAAIQCSECHVVPRDTHDPGHLDTDRPAEVVFGALSRGSDREPSYDASTRRCSDTYCHRSDEASWVRPRSSADACGSCHGLPPAPPHPQSEACSVCHQNVRADRTFIDASEHVDGTVQVFDAGCSSCHGEGDSAAPPRDLAGDTDVAARGVGAHAVHLSGGVASRPVPCEGCHVVPESVEAPGHLDLAPAELVFRGVASSSGRAPVYDVRRGTCADSWCHGPGPGGGGTPSPEWTRTEGALSCTDCHGMPPPSPHPQMADCALCHGEVVSATNDSIIDRERHVDGFVDVLDLETFACNQCHGGTTAAPPRSLAGGASTTEPGVGAHAVHVDGTERSRAVPCSECHDVPEAVLAPGHLDDGAPAELVFSGAATAFGASPRYENGRCSATYCHGDSFVLGHESGGATTTPSWTLVDGSQSTCGSCHGMPPPPPHPSGTGDCSACHENVHPDGSFVDPNLHVNGEVDFLLP